MKILEATDFYYPWIAGPAPFIRNLSEGLEARGHDVVIACPSPTGPRYEEHDSPRRRRVRTWPVPFGYRLRSGFPAADLLGLVRSWRPDVVHIHHPFPISIAAAIAAKTGGIPVVATNHTIPECTLFGIRQSPLRRPITAALAFHIKTVLGSAAAVTTPTETAAAMLRDIGFEAPVTAISNGVDTERFRAGRDDRQPDVPTVLYTGRLDDDKEVEVLIRAVPVVLAQVKARFRIGGEGTDRARLERLSANLGLAEHVRFTGYVSDEELPSVYRGSSIYAISSQVELQSISTLEAMASGLPVVAVKAGALPELVKPGINGLLFEPGDSNAMGAAIADILLNQANSTRMAVESRAIAERHSVGAMITQYERLFEGIATRRVPGAVYGPASN